jgi:hypothetical protein
MDLYDAIAMFDDANTTISKIKKIKQYLRRCFGNKLFIPDYTTRNDVDRRLTKPKYCNLQHMFEKPRKKRSDQNQFISGTMIPLSKCVMRWSLS